MVVPLGADQAAENTITAIATAFKNFATLYPAALFSDYKHRGKIDA
jgi:hypothetical protein